MSTDQVKISFELSATAPGTTVDVSIDSQQIWHGDPSQNQKVEFFMPEIDGEHVLTISLVGKRAEHTQIDSAGNIAQDLLINIADICMDDINIDQLAYQHSVYAHDFNGTRDLTQDRFYGSMGCNGKVMLRFTAPVYLWLLENM